MAESKGQFAWTVVTTDGHATTHTYDIPSSREELVKQMEDQEASIVEAFSGRAPVLLLTNPITVYNPKYVVRLTFDAFGAKELEEMVQKAQRSIGFDTEKGGR